MNYLAHFRPVLHLMQEPFSQQIKYDWFLYGMETYSNTNIKSIEAPPVTV